jgi:hypothetical protein
MASFGTNSPTLSSKKSATDTLLECSSGVALAVNTSRTGFITRRELSTFFQAVNRAYQVPNADTAGEQRADAIIQQVGQDISSVGAAKLKRICLKLQININDFLEKADYVNAATAVTGSPRVVALFSFSAWLHQTFTGHPDKLQRIQDIALDHLVQQTRTASSNSYSSAPNSGEQKPTASATGGGNDKKSRADTGGYSGVNPAFAKSFSTTPGSGGNSSFTYGSGGGGGGGSGSDGSYSYSGGSSNSIDTPKIKSKKRHARRRTMVALDVFSKLDRNSKGSVSRRDFLLALRKDKEVALFLGLPQKITQEGNTREKLENVFQGIGRTTSDSDTITIDEFVEHFRRASVSSEST